MTQRLVFLFLLVTAVAAACAEQPTAPGACPNFCPTDSIAIKDTIFTAIIARDSAFRGYIPSYAAEAMTATDLPGVIDSRAFFTTDTMVRRVAPKVGDTTTVPIVVDSSRVRFTIVRRAKNTTNLRLRLYQLPVSADSTATFSSLDPYFTAAPVDSLNVSDLLALPAISDTQIVRLWGDSIRLDTAGNILQINRADSSLTVFFKLDSLQATLSDADTGRIAWGVRVAADSFASVALATNDGTGNVPLMHWYFHYTIPDTVSATPDSVVIADRTAATRFHNFVFTPATPPLDDNLAVGGVPSSRSLLRVAMPAFLHDSVDIVRATLILVPVSAVRGVPSDSFKVFARHVATDLGAKSPLDPSAAPDSTIIHIGSPDTVRIELGNLVQAWSLDTTLATAIILGQVPEAASYTEIRFYSSRAAPAFRPSLHVTYVKRFGFGEP